MVKPRAAAMRKMTTNRGVATLTNKIEYSFKIGAATLTNRIEYSFEIGAATFTNRIESCDCIGRYCSGITGISSAIHQLSRH
jgi:hypothetical protein